MHYLTSSTSPSPVYRIGLGLNCNNTVLNNVCSSIRVPGVGAGEHSGQQSGQGNANVKMLLYDDDDDDDDESSVYHFNSTCVNLLDYWYVQEHSAVTVLWHVSYRYVLNYIGIRLSAR